MNAADLCRSLLTLGLAMTMASLGTTRLARAQISPGPLARAHRSLEGAKECASCHGLRREPMDRLCLDCHKEVAWLVGQRRGLHAQATVRNRTCASCHPDHAGTGFALIAWDEGSAERFDHRRAGWVLDGGHKTERCEGCHATKYRTSAAAELSPRQGTAGWMGLETRCISCHRPEDVHQKSLGATCDDCHTAQAWDDAPKFDHAASDYPLTGKHADVACDECHLAPRLGIKPGRDGKRVALYKPLPYRECSACHDDVHGGRLGARCASCHDTKNFSTVDRRDFDHSRTKYPLKAKHAAVECAACHGANLARPRPAFATCAACHADPHRGEATLNGAAADCGSCHRVEGFAPSTFSPARHATTRYPLEGKHAQVRCAACHPAVTVASGAVRVKAARIRVPFAECGACHADAHGGQLAGRADKGKCDACHSASGFKPSTYSAAQHATLRVSLDGRHGAVACGACHGAQRPGLGPHPRTSTLGTAKVALQLAETACVACHVDPHAGRYAAGGARPEPGGCAACHAQTRFRPSTVDATIHQQLGFALDGAHRATPCLACHDELKTPRPGTTRTLVRDARGVTTLPFVVPATRTCVSCHESPHGSQFSPRANAGGCEGCHDAESFTTAPRFDHERGASFSLKGAHAKVPCAQCHQQTPDERGTLRVVYRPLDGRCEACHRGRTPPGARS